MVRCPRCKGDIRGVAYTTPDGERLHFGCKELPKVPAQEWLVPWLRNVGLELYTDSALRFVKMERATSVEDLRRNWFALSNYLHLKSSEHYRLAEACGAVPTSSSARTRSSVDESYDIETCLEPWLESLKLLPHLEAAFAWCESAGASCLEDIVERWEDFALGLDLNREEYARLREASLRDSTPTQTEEPTGAVRTGTGIPEARQAMGFYEAMMLSRTASQDPCAGPCGPCLDFYPPTRARTGEEEKEETAEKEEEEETRRQRSSTSNNNNNRKNSNSSDDRQTSQGNKATSTLEVARAPAVSTAGGPGQDEEQHDRADPDPKLEPENWLLEWLSKWKLEQYFEDCRAWCEEMGAAELAEVQENWEDLADALDLDEEARRLLEQAATQNEEEGDDPPNPSNESQGDQHHQAAAEGEQLGQEEARSSSTPPPLSPHAHASTSRGDHDGQANDPASDLEPQADRSNSGEPARSRACSRLDDPEAPSTRKSSLDLAEGFVGGSKSTSASGYCGEFCQDLSSHCPSTSSQSVLFGRKDDPYTLLEKLGSGATSVVHRCSRHGEDFAVKIMNLQRLRMQPQRSTILRTMNRETHLLLNLRHEKIVQLRDFFEVGEQLYLVLDLVSGGDLHDYILTYNAANKRMPEDEARFIFVQLVDALMYIHSKNIVHRDLKLDNILIDSKASKPGRTMVKISDFGHSKAIRDGYTQAKTACGTPQYWAPEQQSARSSGSYDEKVDFWSLGVVLYAMLTGTLPFSSTADSQTATFKFSGSRQAEEVLRGLIRVDPKDRMELQEARSSAWVKQDPQLCLLGAHCPSFSCDFPTEEFRLRLPCLPASLDDFRDALDAFSRKHHIAAGLQVLEVVVQLPCVTETDSERSEAAKQDLKCLLRLHVGSRLPAVTGLHKLRTMRSFDHEIAEKLSEEEENLKAIYLEDFEVLGTAYWSIKLREGITMNVDAARGYPRDAPPSIDLEGVDQATAHRIQEKLVKSWVPGEHCVFEWAAQVLDYLATDTDDGDVQAKRIVDSPDSPKAPEPNAEERVSQQGSDVYEPLSRSHRHAPRSVQKGQRVRIFDEESRDPANQVDLIHGPEVVEKKSKFQAHFARVKTAGQVKWAHRELLSLDRLKNATHNMVAWCYYDYYRSMKVVDFDNDGEPEGGKCLSRVLNHGKYVGIFIMVSRWYGGVELGTERLKVINRVGQQLLELHHVEPETKEARTKKKLWKDKDKKAKVDAGQ